MVAIPVLAGAVLRLVNGVLVDLIGPKRTGMISQLIVLTGLALAWSLGVHSYPQVLALGLVLGVAGASFAVALPLASRWYPQEHQGLALGIAGAGNSGTALAALFAPVLAKHFGWQNVIGLAALPLAVAFVVYMLLAKDAPEQPAPKKLAEYMDVLKTPDAWWLMLLYGVTFGGFVGLASSLTIYFNSEYGLDPVIAGFFTAACVFAGSFIRPVGGALADRFGGVRTLTVVFALAALGLAAASFHAPSAWLALAVLMFSMLALGAGNGAVFQLAPQRFRKEIGVMTGLIGMTGGIGGFYLASTLGMAQEADRRLPDRLPRLFAAGAGRPGRPARPEGPLARGLADAERRRRARPRLAAAPAPFPSVEEHNHDQGKTGRHRQRHGRLPGGRGDPQARSWPLRDRDLRDRTPRQLQPHHALAGAGGREDLRGHRHQ
jgi:MFS transporter, NNP family, nitrate/nitrite transporter